MTSTRSLLIGFVVVQNAIPVHDLFGWNLKSSGSFGLWMDRFLSRSTDEAGTVVKSNNKASFSKT